MYAGPAAGRDSNMTEVREIVAKLHVQLDNLCQVGAGREGVGYRHHSRIESDIEVPLKC
jgi:hypothetical protein